MAIVNDNKEVYYNMYCPICKHKDLPDSEDPCDECLMYPVNTHSHRPVNFEFKEEKNNEKN